MKMSIIVIWFVVRGITALVANGDVIPGFYCAGATPAIDYRACTNGGFAISVDHSYLSRGNLWANVAFSTSLIYSM
jgi:hypothetical protein